MVDFGLMNKINLLISVFWRIAHTQNAFKGGLLKMIVYEQSEERRAAEASVSF